MSLTVATYNISGAINEDDRFYSKRGTPETARRVAIARDNLDAIAAMLADQRVDIAALQEVDVCWNGADTLHQAEYLADKLGMHATYQASFDYNLLGRARVTTGLATLSRQPPESVEQVRFPQRHVGVKNRLKARLLGSKQALVTTHRLGGAALSVVNAHLTHGSHRQRDLELTALVDRCTGMERAVLAGDLNTTPLPTRADDMVEPESFRTDRCMELLARCRRDLGDRFRADARLGDFGPAPPPGFAEVMSYPSRGPSIKLDYLLGFSRAGDLRLGPEGIPHLTASNHLPVIAVVDI